MDKSLHSLDRHFNLPHVREVDTLRALHWLRLGWDDLRENAFASLAYGTFFAVLGYFIIGYAAQKPYLITASISGFLLVGPLAAAGLYVISRQHAERQPVSLMSSLRGLRTHGESLLSIGIALAIVMIGWERISAVLFALLFPADLPEVHNFFRDVFLSGNYLGFVATYMLIGGMLAALVFALTVVAIPMLMERDTDMVTAMMTSLRAVSMNLPAMAVWAAVIVVAMAVGFATLMIGMVVILPLLGHASWHAYHDLVD
ncbi:MAG: DUF2189 domain-containing protein [Rhodocyclaceae bacterium]